MAKNRQIKDLIRSHAEGDDKYFYVVAMRRRKHWPARQILRSPGQRPIHTPLVMHPCSCVHGLVVG